METNSQDAQFYCYKGLKYPKIQRKGPSPEELVYVLGSTAPQAAEDQLVPNGLPLREGSVLSQTRPTPCMMPFPPPSAFQNNGSFP